MLLSLGLELGGALTETLATGWNYFFEFFSVAWNKEGRYIDYIEVELYAFISSPLLLVINFICSLENFQHISEN